ncbi:hypothetical protein [Pseudomonas helleri]|uniref:hypothetical protein n=1 Tax=Pseudomonas helleri TaxID=1608996 RepID=UPI0012959B1C|nr:hypothetical protein [Pseudomonas helleri]MQT34293.1 hypothetical protein [Pseudomonas helleri]
MSILINDVLASEPDSFVKVYGYAYGMIAAVTLANRFSGVMLMIVTSNMDENNEYEISVSDIDKALDIREPKTRTKALNILRLSKLVEIIYDNRTSRYRIRANTKAYLRGTKDSKAKINKTFCEDLDFDILDSKGFIKQSAIDGYKVHDSRKANSGVAV